MSDIEPDNDPLTEWTEVVDIVIDRLQDFFLPADFPLDYSPESLRRLESLVIARYARGVPLPYGDDFIESVVAYAGEVLIRMTGGTWAIGPHSSGTTVEVPYVVPDPALGLPPVHPLRLLVEAAREGSGEVLARVCDAVRVAVAAHPEWTPPAVPAPAEPPASTLELAAWLAARRQAFPQWLSRYAGDDRRFDFSRDSLVALQEMLRKRLPGGAEQLADPEDAELVDGAEWYFGEVIVRNKDGEWVSDGGDVASDAGEPYLHSTARDANSYPRSAVRMTCDPAMLAPMQRMFDVF